MSNDFGNDYITITDDDGQEFTLELIDQMEYNGRSYVAFLPTDIDENDPDFGLIVLRAQVDENNMEYFESIDDDDELQDVFEKFLILMDAESDEEEE